MNLFGKCRGRLLPPPDTHFLQVSMLSILVIGCVPRAIFERGFPSIFQAMGSMNRMVQSYDSPMRNNLEPVNKLVDTEARAKKAEQERDAAVSEASEAKMAREEAEKEAYVNKENAIKLAERNLKTDSEVVRCKRMLVEARGLRDSKMARGA